MAKKQGSNNFDLDTFERRSTKLLKQILFGAQRLSAITSKDTFLMAHRTRLVELNRLMQPTLIERIESMQTFVYPSDIALFLVAADKSSLLDQAVEILDTVENDRRLMSLNDLTAALAETSNMPGSWAAALFGALDAERDATPKVERRIATIDLGAMERGMR